MASTRRRFIQSTALAGAALPAVAQNRTSANDRVQFALIGAGGMGSGDARTAIGLGGNDLVAVCDIYDGRLARAKEVWGDGVFTTRDYREVLARKDVDAVIIATPDHWHSTITIAALEAGKDVYCQKPMVQKVEQGRAVIDAAKKSGRIMQVGSQYVSSLIYLKARDLVRSGAIGQLTLVEAWLDRNTAVGAWQYSIPPDASPANVDWDRFLGSAPKVPFEPIRLFRWRNYRDYGTGVAGDLFVHLLSGVHTVTGAIGPNRIFATGGLRYWKDGRDVPDVMLASLDYPEANGRAAFNLSMRVNFKSSVPAEQFGFRFVGTEGIISAGSSVRLTRPPKETEPGFTIDTFPRATREEFLRQYRKEHPYTQPAPENMDLAGEQVFTPPPGYDAHRDHHRVFWSSVRSRKPVVEDPVFGFRAAAPSLLANASYYDGNVRGWDPETMVEKRA